MIRNLFIEFNPRSALLATLLAAGVCSIQTGCSNTETFLLTDNNSESVLSLLAQQPSPETLSVQTESDQKTINAPPFPEKTEAARKLSETEAGLEAAFADQNLTMNLQAAEAIAISNHPVLAKSRAEIESLNGAWVQAGLRNNPVVGYQGAEIGNNGNAGQNGVYLGQTIMRGGKRLLARDVAAHDVCIARKKYEVEQRRVLNSVRQEFLRTLVSQRRFQLAQELHELVAQTESNVQKLFEAKEVSRIDLIRAQLEVNRTDIIQTNAEAKLKAARFRLASVLSLPDAGHLIVEGDLEERPVESFNESDWDSAITSVLEESPQFAAAIAGRDRATAQVRLERSRAIQDLQTQFSVAFDDDTRYTIGGVQVGLPIPVFNRNQGAIRQAIGELAMSDREINLTELEVKRRLAELLGDYFAAKNRADQLGTTIVPRSEESYDLLLKGYSAGEIDFTTLAVAQRALIESRLLQLDAVEELWAAFYLIEGLTVRD